MPVGHFALVDEGVRPREELIEVGADAIAREIALGDREVRTGVAVERPKRSSRPAKPRNPRAAARPSSASSSLQSSWRRATNSSTVANAALRRRLTMTC